MRHAEPCIPARWTWATVGELAELVQFGTSARCDEDDSGVPVLRMGNIENGALSLAKLKYLPSGHEDAVRLLLQPGDVLFNTTALKAAAPRSGDDPPNCPIRHGT